MDGPSSAFLMLPQLLIMLSLKSALMMMQPVMKAACFLATPAGRQRAAGARHAGIRTAGSG